jgi:hypothetical protein
MTLLPAYASISAVTISIRLWRMYGLTLALNLTFSPRRRSSAEHFPAHYDLRANPAAGFFKCAGSVEALSLGRGFG